MAAEVDSPKTGLIAWITAISLILLFVAFVSLQGLFNLWELRHDKRKGLGTLETPLASYKKEQVAKLDTLEAAKASTLKDAADGKVLAAPPPPAAPAKTGVPTPTK